MRILAYSFNGDGYGHLTSVTALLRALRSSLQADPAHHPNPLDLIILSAADTVWPSRRFKLPLVKLPSKEVLTGGTALEPEVLDRLAALSRAVIES